MRKELVEKEYREAYAKAFLRNSIAFQIHAMRKKLGLSQKELGDLCGMRQNAISRLEDPSYGKLSLETLGKLAAAFDVVPWAGFISFAEMESRRLDLSQSALQLNSFEEDVAGDSQSTGSIWIAIENAADGASSPVIDQRTVKAASACQGFNGNAIPISGDSHGQAT